MHHEYEKDVPAREIASREGAAPGAHNADDADDQSLEPRGSEEPGDRILDRPAGGTPADASSSGQGRSLDREANVASGRWGAPAPLDTTDPPVPRPLDR